MAQRNKGGRSSRRMQVSGTALSCSKFIFEPDFGGPGGRVVLRDLFKTGDAAHLPADHFTPSGTAGGDRAKIRKKGAFSISRHLCHQKADIPFPATTLVQANCRSAMADFSRRSSRSRAGYERNESSVVTYLLLAHRRAAAATDSPVAKTVAGFVSR